LPEKEVFKMNMLSRQSVPGNSVSAHLSLDDSTPVNGDFGLNVDMDNDMLDIDRALSFDPANDQIVGVDLNNINATFSTGVDLVDNDRMDVDTEIDGANGKARDGVAETPEEEVVPLMVVKPKWMIDAKDHLLAIEGGEGWNQLVHDWMEFERLLGYPDREVSIFILTRSTLHSPTGFHGLHEDSSKSLWTPQRLLVDSMRTPQRLHEESLRTP
jgi:hypothetical protein